MRLNGARQTPAPCEAIEGLEHLDKVIDIDQSPIGRTPRSNPATYTGAFTPIRDCSPACPRPRRAATSPAASPSTSRAAAARPARATASSRSRCTSCPTSTSPARSARASATTARPWRCSYKGKSIADVLDMTVEDAEDFFAAVPAIREKMTTLMRVGLGYIKLGQQATTLSGGEAQRVKLAKELARRSTGRTLYILDEPTTGLHFEDIRKLLEVLHELVDAGQHASSSSSTTSTSSRPPTTSSTSAPKAATAAAASSPPAPRKPSPAPPAATPANTSPASSRRAGWRRRSGEDGATPAGSPGLRPLPKRQSHHAPSSPRATQPGGEKFAGGVDRPQAAVVAREQAEQCHRRRPRGRASRGFPRRW